ncbi:MAG TPA: hypothetical protein VFB79_21630 [Candidatus Angelobacter sp.]|nr:hypothetical protein [Candidatus Angelobacter sp.]
MKVDTNTLVLLCLKYGPELNAPEGIAGPQLIWALSGNESSFGAHCPPKHEEGYCYGHKYCDASYSQMWGCLAHCSFSPWQIMATNARQFTPLELMNEPEKAIQSVVSFLNREILGRQEAKTLSQIADAYNSGNWRDNNVPAEYIEKLHRNYLVKMPPVSMGAHG